MEKKKTNDRTIEWMNGNKETDRQTDWDRQNMFTAYRNLGRKKQEKKNEWMKGKKKRKRKEKEMDKRKKNKRKK